MSNVVIDASGPLCGPRSCALPERLYPSPYPSACVCLSLATHRAEMVEIVKNTKWGDKSRRYFLSREEVGTC